MTGRRRWRAGTLALSAGVLVACAVALAALARLGERGRVHRPGDAICAPGVRVRAVRTAREAQAVLREEGGRGRVVVSVSRYLHFQPVEDDEVWRRDGTFPLGPRDLGGFYAERVGVTTALWVAMRTGIAREIVHVVPAATLAEKRAAALADPTDVVAIGDERIVLHHWGSRRVVTARVPTPDEPVVLEVDASYFELGDPARLARELRAADVRADLLVLDAADDNPAVAAGARAALEAFGRALCAGGDRAR